MRRGGRGGEEHKRMKRGWEERKVWGWDRERKRTYERQETPVGSPAEHLSLKRLLLSITLSSPLSSIHLFCLATGGQPKGKERVLKIPPSFLCPSPLLKTCRLHSNRPCLHTELIQLVVMNVCVWGRERECVCSLLLMPLCVTVCVSVCLCACCCCWFFFPRKRLYFQ